MSGSSLSPVGHFSRADKYKEQSLLFYQRGNFEQAILKGIKAAKIYAREGKIKNQIEALIHLARAYHSLGHYKTSLKDLRVALNLTVKIDNNVYMASVLERLAIAHLNLGREEKGEKYLKEGLALAKMENNEKVMASLLNTLGNMYTFRNLYPEAAAAYKESIAIAKKSSNHVIAAKSLANAAAAALKEGNFRETEIFLHSAFEEYDNLPDSHHKAYGLINIAQTDRRMSHNKQESTQKGEFQAYRSLQKAAVIAEAIDDYRSGSYAFGYLGQMYEKEHRYQEALQLTRKAIFAAQQIKAPESLFLWQWQTGRLLKGQGKIGEAVSAYRNAVHTLQAIRQEAYTGCSICNQTSFRDSVRPVFFELADLLIQCSATSPQQGNNQKYLLEARETIEMLKEAELRDYFHDPCLAAYRSKMILLDNLSPDTAIIYIIPLADRLELLLSLPKGIKRVPVQVSSVSLEEEVKLFRLKLEKRTTQEYLVHARRLYDWLIYPLETDLVSHRINTLVFVPDGVLGTVPMAALHDGRQFLIDTFAIAVTQGLNLVDPHPMEPKNTKVLLAGLTESVQGFPALASVSWELLAIQKLYDCRVLENTCFCISSIEKELKEIPYSIVHIASHGEFRGDASRTYLLTWDGKLSMDQIESFLKLTRFRQKPVELLTLSACQTAAGDDRAALGLAGIAVKAGVKSTLATLWFINDRASSELIGEFYHQLRKGCVSKARALQLAQIKLLNDERYQHPCYWSAFLMLGNWL